eukprot:s1366_g28.t1
MRSLSASDPPTLMCLRFDPQEIVYKLQLTSARIDYCRILTQRGVDGFMQQFEYERRVAQLPSSEEVASEVEAIQADAGETDELADESLAAAETAMQDAGDGMGYPLVIEQFAMENHHEFSEVLNRSDVMAQEARNLKIRAAKQAAENRAKILEIAEIFGTK